MNPSMNKEMSFPHESRNYSFGMTLRDYFAAQAMRLHESIMNRMMILCRMVYREDAMLKAREK